MQIAFQVISGDIFDISYSSVLENLNFVDTPSRGTIHGVHMDLMPFYIEAVYCILKDEIFY